MADHFDLGSEMLWVRVPPELFKEKENDTSHIESKQQSTLWHKCEL